MRNKKRIKILRRLAEINAQIKLCDRLKEMNGNIMNLYLRLVAEKAALEFDLNQ